MKRRILSFVIPVLFASTLSVSAQTSSTDGAPATPAPAPTGRGACWQKAGVSETTMEQARSIERQAHSEVEGVRNNLTLAPRQKQFQIREIRMRAKSKMDGLMTPGQQNSLRACQQERKESRTPN